MPNLHPFFTHFPIALLTMSFFFDAMGLILRRNELLRVAWWMMLCGVAGLAGTVATGLLAAEDLEISAVAATYLETHKQAAIVSAAAYSALFLWRAAQRTALPPTKEWAFVLLEFASVIALWTGAWYGGELVYRFGVGLLSPQ